MRRLSRARQAEVVAARAAERHRKRRKKLMAIAAVVAVFAVVALIVAGDLLRKDGSTVRYASQAQGRVLGDANAPVLIEAWEDYQCPVCKQANASVLEQIDKNYVATGKARLEFRNFPFLGPESQTAAEAAECALEQEKFWPYHDALYDAQRAENSGTFSTDKLKSIATGVSLDTGAFNACFDSHRYKVAVSDEKTAGITQGVNATPTFFVDGQRIADWRDYDAFSAVIDKAYATKGGTSG